MKKNNIFASLLILCTLTSCSLHIKDTNGKDNYSLNTINDENILSPNGVVKMAAVQTSVNGSNVYKAKKYSGVEKIATYKNGFTLYVNNVVKLCDMHNIPLATNLATAELMIKALDRGDLDWREMFK